MVALATNEQVSKKNENLNLIFFFNLNSNLSLIELVYDDAKGWLERYNGPLFDVMIFDLSDPLDDGPASLLYTVKFYEFCASKLAPGGIFVTQAGPAGLFTKEQVFTAIAVTVQKAFANIKIAVSHVPSYSDLYGFVFACKTPLPELKYILCSVFCVCVLFHNYFDTK